VHYSKLLFYFVLLYHVSNVVVIVHLQDRNEI